MLLRLQHIQTVLCLVTVNVVTNKISMIRSLFLILYFLICLTGFSQSVKIRGTIYNTKKEIISLVKISEKGNLQNSLITDNTGQYTFSVHPTDSMEIEFNAPDYQPLYITIPNLTKDLVLDIILKNKDNALGEVVVEGQRQTVNMTVDLFDPSRRAYMLDSSIESLVVSMSGVSTTSDLSSQYMVRGGNFDENIIYVNGVEIYRPLLIRSGQQEGLSFINPNMVNAVAFSTGGYDAEYGDKMSSVLSILYKKPKKLEGSVKGSFMDAGIYVGNATKRFSQMTSFRYKSNRSILGTTDTKAEYKPSFADLQTYITYQLSNKWQASFLGNYSHNTYQFTPQTRETTFGTIDNVRMFKVFFNGWENDKFITYQGALTLKGKINDNLAVGVSGIGYSSQEQEFYDIEGQYVLTELSSGEDGAIDMNGDNLLGVGTHHQHARNKLDINVLKGEHFGNLKLNRHLIKWGLSVQREQTKDKIKEWEMRDSTGYSLPHDGISVNLFSNLKSDNKLVSTRFAGYVQEKFQLRTGLGLFSLNAGVRGAYWDFNNELLISPRISLFFIPSRNENFVFKIAGGLYYQAPFYKEYQHIVNIGGNNIVELNKDIKSQKAIHYIIGGDYHFKSNGSPFKLTSELYYKDLHDLIPYTINNVKVRYSGLNEGTGHIMGLDMRLYGEFVPGTTSWVSFSLMKTEQNINGVKTPLPTDQRYNFSIYLQDYMPGYDRLKMNLKGSYTQGIPIAAPQQTFANGYFRTPSYKRVDLGLSWEILGEDYAIRQRSSFCKAFKNIWLGLDVTNLLDTKNINTYYWVSDVHNNQYAVPNYLTGRQLNIKLLADF